MTINEGQVYTQYVTAPRERPPFEWLQKFVWEKQIDTDTDGNAIQPNSTAWTELTVITRDDKRERFDIDPVREEPLILKIRSEKEHLAARVAYALAVYTGGKVSESSDGPFDSPQTLISKMGKTFDLSAALRRNLWLNMPKPV